MLALRSLRSARQCPHCGSANVSRSRWRGASETFLGFGIFRPYRCQDCKQRFWRTSDRQWSATRTKVAEVALYVFVILVFGGFCWLFLQTLHR